MTKYLQESRMREIRTSGLTRGSNGTGTNRPSLSTLPSIRGCSWIKEFKPRMNANGHKSEKSFSASEAEKRFARFARFAVSSIFSWRGSEVPNYRERDRESSESSESLRSPADHQLFPFTFIAVHSRLLLDQRIVTIQVFKKG